MKNFLYLLPFENNKYFKIGISQNSLNRIYENNKNFKIDLEKSLIIEGKNRTVIKSLEYELLLILPTPDVCDFPKNSGHTEIRDICHREAALNLIKNKHQNLELNIKKLSDYRKKINFRSHRKNKIALISKQFNEELFLLKFNTFKENLIILLKSSFSIKENIISIPCFKNDGNKIDFYFTENKGISFEILLSSLKESSINLEILNFNFWHNKGNILYGVSNQISEKNYVKLILNIPYFKNEVYESCTNEIIKILSVTSGNLYKINQ